MGMNREDLVAALLQTGLTLPGAGRPSALALAGRGALAAVFACREEGVAVKVCLPAHDEARFVANTARFSQEIAVLQRLSHPHLMPCLGFGRVTVGPHTLPYYVMPLAAGSLADRIAQNIGPQALAANLKACVQILSALAFLHMNGVAHGDLKPENLLLAPDGTPRLADLSAAVLIDPDTQPPTDVPAPLRRDMTLLGRTIYQLVTGRRLRSGSPPLAAVHGALAPLDPVIGRLSLAEPAGRYRSLAEAEHEMAQALPLVLGALAST